MKLKSIEVHNVGGIKDIRIGDLSGHHLFFIGGENGNGKTTVLDSIAMLICGRRGCNYPQVPIRNGASSGVIRGELIDCEEFFGVPGITIERKIVREDDGSTSDKLVVTSDGKRVKTTQELLNTIYKSRGFDPSNFLAKDAKEKAKEFAAVTGLDFTELNRERKRIYDERTDANREVVRLTKLFESVSYAEAPEQKLRVSDLVTELEAARKHNSQLETMKRRDEELTDRIKVLNREMDLLHKQIAELQKQLLEKHSEVISKVAERESNQEKIDWFTPEDVAAIEAKIRDVEKINAAVEQNQKKKSHETELKQAEEKSTGLTEKIEEIDTLKARMLSDAKFPVTGVSITEDGIWLNGVPLEQCSTREQISVAVQIAIRQNPGLKLLVIKNGNLLDNNYLATIEEIAKAEDFQILVEWVTHGNSDEDRCQVVLKEGRLK